MEAVLMLEDGRRFTGRAFGAVIETLGEVVFNTSMTGYQEVLTDPSYCGQIVVMTYPLIGNYGVNHEDLESGRVQVAGFAVREYCRTPSNFRSQQSLADWMAGQGIAGIEGIDTRALTRHIREAGSMNGILSASGESADTLLAKVKAAPRMAGLDLVKRVTCSKSHKFEWPGTPGRFRVAVIDCGAKLNICRELARRGAEVWVVPATATAEDILKLKPAGLMVSNGPGDPAAVTYLIATLQKLVGRLPIFGICLGHQLLALALGGRTHKLKFGHRGANHPVKDLARGTVAITSQNHGFCVDPDSLPPEVEVTQINMNDRTVEGLRHKRLPVFAVQYHPEAAPGPNDAKGLFDEFVKCL